MVIANTPPAYLEEAVGRARATRDAAVRDFGALGRHALNWKPAPDRWSVAQCLEHLIATNEAYAATFGAVADGTHRRTLAERIPLLPRLFGPLVRWSMTPGSAVRVKTTQAFVPSSSDLPGQIVEDFRASVDDLIEQIERLDHVDHDRVVVTSPFAGFVTYSLRHAVQTCVAHLERHRLQAVRVTDREGFPATGAS